MEEGKTKKGKSSLQGSFVTGAIALVFLIIGYQTALLVHKAAVTRIAANQDRPDTVYVVDRALAEKVLQEIPAQAGNDVPGSGRSVMTGFGRSSSVIVRKEASHSQEVKTLRSRTVESFRFNPNTVSAEDLQRLGFSEKQALSIVRYREKGGRFRRKTDFAKSYVVADSVYARLEPFIDIPLLDINRADSAAFLSLPGIGPYFAGKIVAYRTSLGGFSCAEQLMEIYHFDKEKFDGLADLISCPPPEPYPLWTLPETELARHPHISRPEAHGIVLYRQHNQPEACTVEGLLRAGVLSQAHADRLKLCSIAPLK